MFRRKILGPYSQGCETDFVILEVTECRLRWSVWGSGLWLEVVLTTYTMMKMLLED